MKIVRDDDSVNEDAPGYVVMPFNDQPAFSDYIGPYYTRENHEALKDDQLQLAFRVQEKHLNVLSICHGGVIASFLDDLMGWAAYLKALPGDVVTTDLATRFISAAKLNDLIEGTAHILSASRALVHVEGRLHTNGKLVAFASGTWRRLTPRLEVPAAQ